MILECSCSLLNALARSSNALADAQCQVIFAEYNNFPKPNHVPPNPLPAGYKFYEGERCPECLWNAIKPHGYVSSVAFDHDYASAGGGERTVSIFGLLQRNKKRDVRHLWQSAAGRFRKQCRSPAGQPEIGIFENTLPMLDYTESFFDAYADVPKFSYMNRCAACFWCACLEFSSSDSLTLHLTIQRLRTQLQRLPAAAHVRPPRPRPDAPAAAEEASKHDGHHARRPRAAWKLLHKRRRSPGTYL